jgi:hypothetical protein
VSPVTQRRMNSGVLQCRQRIDSVSHSVESMVCLLIYRLVSMGSISPFIRSPHTAAWLHCVLYDVLSMALECGRFRTIVYMVHSTFVPLHPIQVWSKIVFMSNPISIRQTQKRTIITCTACDQRIVCVTRDTDMRLANHLIQPIHVSKTQGGN